MTPSSVSPSTWLEISRDDFLAAIKSLKPARVLKSYLSKELQIGLIDQEAVFCIEGVQVRHPAKGDWTGFASVKYGMLHAFLKVKPTDDPIRLAYEGQRLRVGTTRFGATWINVSPWIGEKAKAQ